MANAVRHVDAQQKRFRLNDRRETLVLQAAAAFNLMLQDQELAPIAVQFLNAVKLDLPKPGTGEDR